MFGASPLKYHASSATDPEKIVWKESLFKKPLAYAEISSRTSSASSTKPPSGEPCSLKRSKLACCAFRYRYFRRQLTSWVCNQRKPYSAVTVQIDRLTSEQIEEDDVGGIIDLVEVVRIQESGPTEAARAIRKKLKYGSPHRQLRALVILDGLIQNAGSRFQRAFADEPLLERLRLMARDDVVDPQVRTKCQVLFVQWANAYNNTPGLERIASLYKDLPNSKRAATRPKVLQETDAFDSHSDIEPAHVPSATGHSRSSSNYHTSSSASAIGPVTLTPTSSSSFSALKLSRGKKDKSIKPFSLAREQDAMKTSIANASIASTNLLNGLQLINRETQRVSENQEVVERFEMCKNLRRQILQYIQRVESDNWIGSLVNANDELVKALTAFEIMDKSVDDDSDSEVEANATQRQLEGLHFGDNIAASRAKPSRPTSITMPPPPVMQPIVEPEVEEDENDPFGDSHVAATPAQERPGMTWREV